MHHAEYGELINPLTRRFTQLIGTGYLRLRAFNYISFSSTSIRFPPFIAQKPPYWLRVEREAWNGFSVA